MIFEDVAQEWRDRGRDPPHDPQTARAERWWRWHDRARAMTHVLYADRGWHALTEGPISDDEPASGAALIERDAARDVAGDEVAYEGAQAGIETAMTEISTTLTDALRTLPRPLQPVWSGAVPLPPED